MDVESEQPPRITNDDGYPIALFFGYDAFVESMQSSHYQELMQRVIDTTPKPQHEPYGKTVPVHSARFELDNIILEDTLTKEVISSMNNVNPTCAENCKFAFMIMVMSKGIYDYMNMILFHIDHVVVKAQLYGSTLEVTLRAETNVELKRLNSVICHTPVIHFGAPKIEKLSDMRTKLDNDGYEADYRQLFSVVCGTEGYYSPMLAVALDIEQYANLPRHVNFITPRPMTMLLMLLKNCKSIAVVCDDGPVVFNVFLVLKDHDMTKCIEDVYTPTKTVVGVMHRDLVVSLDGAFNNHIVGRNTLILHQDEDVKPTDLKRGYGHVWSGISNGLQMAKYMTNVDTCEPESVKIVAMPIPKTSKDMETIDERSETINDPKNAVFRYLCGETIEYYEPPAGDDKEFEECAVCMLPMKCPITIGKCGHKFCQSCIEKWIGEEEKRSCPTCRSTELKLTPPPPNAKLVTPLLTKSIVFANIAFLIDDCAKRGLHHVLELPSIETCNLVDAFLKGMYKDEYKTHVYNNLGDDETLLGKLKRHKAIAKWRETKTLPAILLNCNEKTLFIDDIDFETIMLTTNFKLRMKTSKSIRILGRSGDDAMI